MRASEWHCLNSASCFFTRALPTPSSGRPTAEMSMPPKRMRSSGCDRADDATAASSSSARAASPRRTSPTAHAMAWRKSTLLPPPDPGAVEPSCAGPRRRRSARSTAVLRNTGGSALPTRYLSSNAGVSSGSSCRNLSPTAPARRGVGSTAYTSSRTKAPLAVADGTGAAGCSSSAAASTTPRSAAFAASFVAIFSARPSPPFVPVGAVAGNTVSRSDRIDARLKSASAVDAGLTGTNPRASIEEDAATEMTVWSTTAATIERKTPRRPRRLHSADDSTMAQ
mmetsp:Transcript_3361/g.10435  ORF Transcript_3361/g.10435 Transcript_3361/m.10435 type:complete len:282 (+) Transcript_3361:233-1078(+)